MSRKSRFVVGLLGGILLICLSIFVLLPPICRAIGRSQYSKAAELGEKIAEVASKGRDPESHVMPEDTSRQTAALISLKIKVYNRAVMAFSLARSLNDSSLNDEDLVALANARIGALGDRYPPLHTVSEMRKELESAKSDLEEALRLNPNNKEAYSSLIGAHFRTFGRFPEKAVEVCERFEAAFPDDPDMHAACGLAYGASQDTVSAELHFLRAAELDPANTANLYLSMELVGNGRLEEAKAFLNRYIEANPPQAYKRTAENKLESIKMAEEKVKEYESVITKDPDDFEAIRKLAETYSSIGAFKVALKWHERAYELQPDNVDAMMRLAGLRLSHNPEGAIELYKKLLEKEDARGSRNRIMMDLGKANLYAGNLDEALAWLKKAESEPWSWTIALFYIAECYDKMGNQEMAEQYSRKYLEERTQTRKKRTLKIF